jgi:RNA polymerase sigma factor (TIGR02999 family)
MPLTSDNLAELMSGFRRGEKPSVDQLVENLYPELRRLAAARMRRECADHSWRPTELISELYLELARSKALGAAESGNPEERSAFLGLAGFLMGQLLIRHSRPLRFRASHVGTDVLDYRCSARPGAEDLRFVEELLARLESIDPRVRTVVELRVFEGMTNEEIAGRLGCSVRTVGTCWSFARRWLESEIGR